MAASSSGVRPASTQDAAACLAIYRPYVQNTAISWEIDVPTPTVGEMAARIDGLRATHEWLVLERDAQIIGFAYGQPLKRLIALQWSAETGIYVHDHHHRAGAGRELYTQLLRRLTDAATGEPSRASLNPTRPATAFIDPSGSRTPAYIGVWRGSTMAGTTWHGCNSIRLTPAARKDRLARSGDPRRASDGPLRNRQCAMPLTDGFAKLEPWTRRPPAVRPDP